MMGRKLPRVRSVFIESGNLRQTQLDVPEGAGSHQGFGVGPRPGLMAHARGLPVFVGPTRPRAVGQDWQGARNKPMTWPP